MLHLLQFYFAPAGQPWYTGAVWSNVVAILPCGVLGVIWSKTKFWPLNLIHTRLADLSAKHQEVLASHVEIHRRLDELHAKHDHLLTVLSSGSGGGPSKPA